MKKTFVFMAIITAVVIGACNGTSVGSISRVVSPRTYVNNVEKSDGASVYAADVIKTDSKGQADFRLDQKTLKCLMKPSSEVQVHPDNKTLVKWNSGQTNCSTGPGASYQTVTKNNTAINGSDPVFEVIVEEGQDTVTVAYGFLLVESLDTRGSVILGPKQETTIIQGNDPQVPIRVELSPLEQNVLDDFLQENPIPDLERPTDIEGSVTLGRILEERQEIVVAMDARQGASRRDEEFVGLTLELLAESWEVRSILDQLPDDLALAAMDNGDLDLFISPQPPDQLSSVPLFQGEDSRVWRASFREDNLFAEAFAEFVRQALEQNRYGELYLEAFDDVPAYQLFETLLFREPVDAVTTPSTPKPTSTSEPVTPSLTPPPPPEPESDPSVLGTIRYQGRPLTDFSSGSPTLWIRDEQTNQGAPFEYSYDQSTAEYKLFDLPAGSYGIQVSLDSDGNGWPHPNDFYAWSTFTVAEDQGITGHDIDVLEIIHMTLPADNNAVFPGPPSSSYPTFRPHEAIVEWEAMPNAETYEIIIDQYRHEPSYARMGTLIDKTTTDNIIFTDLPASADGQHYQLRLYANDNEGRIGLLMINYESGIAWDFRFRVEQ